VICFVITSKGKDYWEGEALERTSFDLITGIPQGYVVYISVKKGYQGKYVAQRLTNSAAIAFASAGYNYFSGEMVCKNLHPGKALQKLYRAHFAIENV